MDNKMVALNEMELENTAGGFLEHYVMFLINYVKGCRKVNQERKDRGEKPTQPNVRFYMN